MVRVSATGVPAPERLTRGTLVGPCTVRSKVYPCSRCTAAVLIRINADQRSSSYRVFVEGTLVAEPRCMQLPRWQRHWWEWVSEPAAVPTEPSVLVDPSLYVEPPARAARGTLPPPTLIGPHCLAVRRDDGD